MAKDSAPAQRPQVPVERIQQLPIPGEIQPVLMDTVRYVLANPERFDAAAKSINADLQAKTKPNADGDAKPPVFWLTYMLPDAARETPPALGGGDYELWAHRLMLLATVASYPGDLSRFGVCGAIPWDHGTVHAPLSSKKDDTIPLPVPGRSWILCELGGDLRDGMTDKSGEHVEHRYGELVDGKRQDVVKRTPWQSRGVLGLLVDRLKPILAELPRAGAGTAFAATHGKAIAPAPVSDGDDAGEQCPALTRTEQVTLRAMASFDPSILASARQIVEAMDPDEAISERTVTPALRKLVEFNLAERPEGERRGTRLTLKGRRLAAKMPKIAD